MILNLSSTLPSFKELEFKSGLNILVAERDEVSGTRDTRNGTGKTSMIELIHYLLAEKRNKDDDFHKAELADHSFTGTFKVDGAEMSITKKAGLARDSLALDGEDISAIDLRRKLGLLWFQLHDSITSQTYYPTIGRGVNMMDDDENDNNELPHHPDRHAIDDWMLNGPKNGRIEELVRELTLGLGLRLSVVEDIIVNVLLAQRNISRRCDPAIEGKSGPEIGAVQLANDVAAQFKMLNEAYATGSAEAIEAAVIKVAEARRMMSIGIADMLALYSDDDAS